MIRVRNIVAALVLSHVLVLGQQVDPVERLKARAEAGDHNAVWDLGKRDDPALIPFLLKIKEKPGISPQLKREVQKALARLGDEGSFEEVVKELKDPDRVVRDDVFIKLRYIGGRKTITLLYRLLDDPTPGWMDGDAFYPSFRYRAAETLRDLVPNRPALRGLGFDPSPEGTAKYVKEWKEWFAKHPEWLKPQ